MAAVAVRSAGGMRGRGDLRRHVVARGGAMAGRALVQGAVLMAVKAMIGLHAPPGRQVMGARPGFVVATYAVVFAMAYHASFPLKPYAESVPLGSEESGMVQRFLRLMARVALTLGMTQHAVFIIFHIVAICTHFFFRQIII